MKKNIYALSSVAAVLFITVLGISVTAAKEIVIDNEKYYVTIDEDKTSVRVAPYVVATPTAPSPNEPPQPPSPAPLPQPNPGIPNNPAPFPNVPDQWPPGNSFPGGPSWPGTYSPPSLSVDWLSIAERLFTLGEKVYGIIKENKPVIDTDTQYFSAVPEEVKNSQNWEKTTVGWQPPMAKVYNFVVKGLFGNQAVKCKYQVMWRHGGSYQGKGQYLSAVTIQPLSITAGWGWKVNFAMEIARNKKDGEPLIFNEGTLANPMAGIIFNLRWTAQKNTKSHAGNFLYYLRGDGLFKELGEPSSAASAEIKKQNVKSAPVLPDFSKVNWE